MQAEGAHAAGGGASEEGEQQGAGVVVQLRQRVAELEGELAQMRGLIGG